MIAFQHLTGDRVKGLKNGWLIMPAKASGPCVIAASEGLRLFSALLKLGLCFAIVWLTPVHPAETRC